LDQQLSQHFWRPLQCKDGRNPSASGADVQKIYDYLLPQIGRIPIYDNHSHATFPDESDMDAQAAPPDESSVLRLRDSNPEFVAAAKALFRAKKIS